MEDANFKGRFLKNSFVPSVVMFMKGKKLLKSALSAVLRKISSPLWVKAKKNMPMNMFLA